MGKFNFNIWDIVFHHYPQYNWAQALTDELKILPIRKEDVFFDAPCGNGVISYWLKKNFPRQKFELNDKSAFFSKIVYLWSAKNKNIQFKQNDLYNLPHSRKANDIWLLINSLYLFVNPRALIQNQKNRFKYIIGIFPYLEKQNLF